MLSLKPKMAAEATILRIWQATRDSNPQHSVLETDALPVELVAFIWFRAQKYTAPQILNQAFICLITVFNYGPFKGEQLCHYLLLKQLVYHSKFSDYPIKTESSSVFIVLFRCYRTREPICRFQTSKGTLISIRAITILLNPATIYSNAYFICHILKFFWPSALYSLKIRRL